MKKYGVLIAFVLPLLLVFSIAHAERTVWYVHPDSALNTIQAGLDSCAHNDIVLVAPGTYVENIVWPNTQGIHLISELDPEVTIIDGDSAGSVIVLNTGADSTTIINGFTVRNGYADLGGGIGCFYGSSPTIANNIITNNTAGTGGGGMSCVYSSSPIITNNIITNNTAFAGGGIFCGIGSSPIITNNIITENTADGYGGGIGVNGSSPTITDNTITENTAGFGGGITCTVVSSPTIANNIITNNTAGAGGGIFCVAESSPTITGNTITGDTASVFGGGITCWNSSPTITGDTITGNTASVFGSGIFCWNSSPTIDSCTISSNNGDGVCCDSASNPVIHYCDIMGNIGYGVCNLDSAVIVNAQLNWWGDSTGPYHPTSNPGGLGDSVSDYVDFDPWLVGIEVHKPIQPVATILQINPNPFRARVNIRWQTPNNQQAHIAIYDAMGRLVTEYTDVTTNKLIWRGKDGSNRKLPSGVYFLKFTTERVSETRKLLLIR